MKKILGTIAVLAAAMPFAAQAADLPAAAPAYKAPVLAPTPAYNWTGFYIGASAGGEWESIDGNFTLGPGDYARYSGDGPHVYRSAEEDCHGVLLVGYPPA